MNDFFSAYPKTPLPQEDLSIQEEIDRVPHFADAISSTLRLVATNFDENLNPYSTSVASPDYCKIRALALWPARTIVPVIFIPGIMGTNLANKGTGKDAWLPPNGLNEKLKEFRSRKNQSAAAREIQLNPANCFVKERNDAINLNYFPSLNADEAIRRHWGEVHAESYLGVLQSLEENLNYPYDIYSVMARIYGFGTPVLKDIWQNAIRPKTTGDKLSEPIWKPKSPLTEAELRSRLGKIYFPVFACGYNWLESNMTSAKCVAERIAEIDARIKRHQAQKKVYFNDYPGKFILVTHSMGGLVARAAAQLPELKDKILGVVHGVQPVTGAPVVYRRFKAGTEHHGLLETGAAYVLGYGADNVTCVMACAPGPLELLPTQYYEPGWLQITDGRKTISLPWEEDSYKEIYEIPNTKKWWGMVDPSLIDPAKLFQNMDPTGDPFEDGFRAALKTAREFHESLKLSCHPNTYAYYGDDSSQRSFPRVIWRTSSSLDGFNDRDILNAKIIRVDMQGETEVLIDGRKKVIFKPDYKPEGLAARGDGTVPERSGSAVARLEGIRDVFKLKGFNHQTSYENEIALHTVFYALGKMMQEIKVREEAACKF
jgi:pimeloyl-ACP methyl ester carboxylesterase